MEARLEKLLAAAPGPAPWSWNSFPRFDVGAASWTWRSEPIPGRQFGDWPVLQRDADGVRCFVPAFSTYVAAAGDGRLLAWRSGLSGELEIRLYPVTDLGAVDLPSDPPRHRDIVSRRASELIRIPRLERGVHEDFAPRTPVALEELLLLAPRPASSGDEAALAIYVWRPSSGRITVSPQPWFTPATHDLGYEWVMKVARDPTTGRIVGGGMRLAPFELEDDDATVRRFLQP